jgi:hypothetical protein
MSEVPLTTRERDINMHSETTSRQHSTALRSALVPSGGPQAETALLPPMSTQPATAGGVIPLPSVFLTVVFPNGGETFNARDTVTVRWSTSVQDGTLITSHEVRLFADGNLVTEVTGLPGTTQSYQLTRPDITTTRAVVSVTVLNGIRVLAGDRSDNVFTIQGSSTGPVITAIDPPAIRAGATTRVTVNGMNLPTNAGAYAVVNSAGQRFLDITLLPLSISATATVGVTITATMVSLTVGGGLMITGFTPTSGPEGTDVEISGPNLAGATGVLFGSVSAPEFTVNPSGGPEPAPAKAGERCQAGQGHQGRREAARALGLRRGVLGGDDTRDRSPPKYPINVLRSRSVQCASEPTTSKNSHAPYRDREKGSETPTHLARTLGEQSRHP